MRDFYIIFKVLKKKNENFYRSVLVFGFKTENFLAFGF
jgi:hypothetical protein